MKPTSAKASTSAKATLDKTVGKPTSDKLLLGPGPSPVADRVMRAMAAPVLSHLDPEMMAILDDIRARLATTFKAADGSLSLAISGTGTSGMEAAVGTLTRPGTRAVAVVNGYFGDRLAQMLQRYGASVTRVDAEWGRACDPARLGAALADGADLVTVVHAETSTGVLNPVADMCALATARGAMTIVDAVTSLGAHPVDAAAWGADVVYGCTQKGLGAPSGLAPIVFSQRAREFRLKAETTSRPEESRSFRLQAEDQRSFYFDLKLLEDYWVNRKYHHTISAPLVYALREALVAVAEEGLEARWERHRVNHLALVEALDGLGLQLLPPPAERLWSLNAVALPAGPLMNDEARIRKRLLDEHAIEIGAGLGPLAGKIWRVGLMGSGSSRDNITRLAGALKALLP
jgi:alanine-glyoxylate transaminase/serine-glyoxylate transaminase/serine-pyruvate transaminase